VVVRQKNGRAYVYSPALDLEAARIAAVQRLLDNLFNHDPHALVQFLQREAGPADQAKASRQRKPVPVRMAGRVHIDDSLL
jgi:predicted transcriptional regulator